MIANSRPGPLRHCLHWLLLLLIGAACGGTEPEEVFEPTEEQAVAMFTTMLGSEPVPPDSLSMNRKTASKHGVRSAEVPGSREVWR